MSKLRVGNKENSFLNGEWAGHVVNGVKNLLPKSVDLETKKSSERN